MSTLALPRTEPALPAGPVKKRLSPWQAWGMIMIAPYVIVFLVFVLYPICYGLLLARHPASYVRLVDDPIFARSVVNTLVFVIVGINLKMIVALSGVLRADPHVDQVASLVWSCLAVLSIRRSFPSAYAEPEWGIINHVIFRLTGADGPNWLNDPYIALRWRSWCTSGNRRCSGR